MKFKDNVIGIQHIGIPTDDMNSTKKFYEGLGFEIIYETLNVGSKVVFFRMKDIVIESYESTLVIKDSGSIDHIAINVKDINEAYTQVKQRGYKFVENITKLMFWNNGVKFFVIEGPNHEKIEFNQYL